MFSSLDIFVNNISDSFPLSSNCDPSFISLGFCSFRSAWQYCHHYPFDPDSSLDDCSIHLPANSHLILDPIYGQFELSPSKSIKIYGNNATIEGHAVFHGTISQYPEYIIANNLHMTESATINYAKRCIIACPGDELLFSSCDTGVGDTYYRLWQNSTMIAQNDDSCDLVSELSYQIPSSGGCDEYCLHVGCYGYTTCSQTVSLTHSMLAGSIFQHLFVYGTKIIERDVGNEDESSEMPELHEDDRFDDDLSLILKADDDRETNDDHNHDDDDDDHDDDDYYGDDDDDDDDGDDDDDDDDDEYYYYFEGSMNYSLEDRPSTLELHDLTIKNFGSVTAGVLTAYGELNIYFESVRFESNFGVSVGGALFFESSPYHKANVSIFHRIENCTFVNNTASSGGSIYYSYSQNLLLENNLFRDSGAKYGGGVMIATGNAITLSNNIFESCEAVVGGGILISSNSVDITLDRNEFHSCQSTSSGAGVSISSSSDILISRLLCHDTQSDDTGGCVAIDSSREIILQNSTIIESVAMIGGGISIQSSGQITLRSNHLLFCEALMIGGGLSVSSSYQVRLTWNIFEHNLAHESGGGISFIESLDNLLNHVVMTYCVARSGGGLSIDSEKHLRLYHTTISHSVALQDGGGISSEQSFAPHFKVHIWNCTADNSGGGIYFGVNTTNAVSLDAVIENNHAQNSGGGIYLKNKNSNFVVTSTIVQNNYGSYGGGIFIGTANDSPILIDRHGYESMEGFESAHPANIGYYFLRIFKSNATSLLIRFDPQTKFGKGDLLMLSARYRPHANETDSSDIIYNMNSNLPGVDCPILRVDRKWLYISFRVSYSHKVSYYGFKLFIYPVYSHSSQKTLIRNNFASNFGGGISYSFSNPFPLIINTDITNNNALRGAGGMHIKANNNGGYLIQTSFRHNKSPSGSGGGLTVSALIAGLKIEFCEFISNSAGLFGGAISSIYQNGVGGMEFGNEMNISSTTFISNNATSGGGLYFEFGNIIVLDNIHGLNNRAVGGNGGVILLESQNNITIKNSTFHRNYALQRGGVLSSLDSNLVHIDSSNFQDNHVNGIGGALNLQNNTQMIFRGEIKIHSNMARLGGGGISSIRCPMWSMMSTSGSTSNHNEVSLTSLLLSNNEANWGSALLFSAFQKDSSGLGLRNVTMKKNRARIAGTIYWVKDIEMSDEVPGVYSESVRFENNSATYGPVIATQPVRILTPPRVQVMGYGTPITPSIELKWLDHYGNDVISPVVTTSVSVVILDDNQNPIECLGKPAYLEGSDIGIDSVKFGANGSAFFSNLIPYCVPNGNMTIQFTAQLGNLYLPSQVVSKYYIKNTTRLSFRSCVAGEYISDGECVPCASGSFSFHFDFAAQCSDCTKIEGLSGCDTNQLYLKPGYWRRTPDTTAVFLCPLVSSSCFGGNLTGSEGCSVGYTGPLCSVCDTGYFSSENLCLPCEAESLFTPAILIYILITIITIGILLALFLFRKQIVETLQREEQIEESNRIRRLSSIISIQERNFVLQDRLATAQHLIRNVENTNEQEYMSEVVIETQSLRSRVISFYIWIKKSWSSIVVKAKIIVATYQVVVGMGEVISVKFPNSFTSFTNAFSIFHFNLWNAVPLGCTIQITFIDKLVLATLAPIAFTSLLWIGFLIEYFFHTTRNLFRRVRNASPSESKEIFTELKGKYTNILFYLSYLILPSVTSTIFEIFLCENIDPYNEDTNPTDYYLKADRTISCTSTYYYNGLFYAVCMIVVYPIGIPAMYFYVLYQNREEIMSRNIEEEEEGLIRKTHHNLSKQAQRISFLFDAYEPKHWYWELIETFRRLTLTAVISVIANGTSEQAVISVLLSIFFVKLYAFYAPYLEDGDDVLAEVGQYQILFSFFCGMVIQSELVRSSFNGYLGGFLVTINIGVILVPVYFAFKEYHDTVRKTPKREMESEKDDDLPVLSPNQKNKKTQNHQIYPLQSQEHTHSNSHPFQTLEQTLPLPTASAHTLQTPCFDE